MEIEGKRRQFSIESIQSLLLGVRYFYKFFVSSLPRYLWCLNNFYISQPESRSRGRNEPSKTGLYVTGFEPKPRDKLYTGTSTQIIQCYNWRTMWCRNYVHVFCRSRGQRSDILTSIVYKISVSDDHLPKICVGR